MSIINFDEDAQWFGEVLTFYADEEKKRIKCVASREAINALPGFKRVRSDEIERKKKEIRDALKPIAEKKIAHSWFDEDDRYTIRIESKDVLSF